MPILHNEVIDTQHWQKDEVEYHWQPWRHQDASSWQVCSPASYMHCSIHRSCSTHTHTHHLHTHTHHLHTYTHTIFCSISTAISRLISVRQFPPVLPPVVLEENRGDKWHWFYAPDALPVTRPTASKHLRELRARTLTTRLMPSSATNRLLTEQTMGDFIFPLKPSFKLGFKPNFGLKPN